MRGTSRSPTCARCRPSCRTDHPGIEFNIEGDPRPDLLALVHEVRPDQCTLVPVREGEVTSQAGWPPSTPRVAAADDHPRPAARRHPRERVHRSRTWRPCAGRRRSTPIAIELYTEPFARAYRGGRRRRKKSFERVRRRRDARPQPRPRHQRRPRSRSRQPDAVPDAPAPRRGVDRPRAHQPRAVRRAGPGGAGTIWRFWAASSGQPTPGPAVTKPLTAEHAEIAENQLWLCVLGVLSGESFLTAEDVYFSISLQIASVNSVVDA